MSPKPSSPDRIVAVGLLTQRDVDVLGIGFRRLFPLESDHAFDDLLRELDRLDRTPADPRRPA
jgi:hypothetical protein